MIGNKLPGASVGRYALTSCIALALLAGCGRSQPLVGAPKTAQPSREVGIMARDGKSWMDASAPRQDLLYVANLSGTVTIYRYWHRKLVGKLFGFQSPRGACVDADGSVYVVDYRGRQIVEYAHGGTQPINVIDDSPYEPSGCAVNLHNGDLAVANGAQGTSACCGNVAIYRNGKGEPIYYTDHDLSRYQSCAYDDSGNLFVTDGVQGSSYGSSFAYLRKGGQKLVTIVMRKRSSWNGGFNGVDGLAWDGKNWVLNTGVIYRVAIKNKRGRPVGWTKVEGSGYLTAFWVYNNHIGSQGTQVVGVWHDYQNGDAIGYWKYPAGGGLVGEITKGLDEPYGVAVSLKE